MADKNIRKEKKKPKAGEKAKEAVLKPPMPQPEVIRKERKEK